MARIELDLRPLIAPGIAALIGLVVLGVTLQVTQGWLADKERAFDRARSELSQAASQYRNASDDQAVYEEYAARFRAISERGWIGPEERLSWIEALRRINSELQLPTLRYDIAQRQRVPLDGTRLGGDRLDLYRTPMTLTIGALHEGDLLTLLERLRERGSGLLVARSCDLERAGGGDRVRLAAGAENVEARCAIQWLGLEIEPEERVSR